MFRQVVLGEQHLKVTVNIDDSTDYTIDLILQHPINPDTSTNQIFKTKVQRFVLSCFLIYFAILPKGFFNTMYHYH